MKYFIKFLWGLIDLFLDRTSHPIVTFNFDTNVSEKHKIMTLFVWPNYYNTTTSIKGKDNTKQN